MTIKLRDMGDLRRFMARVINEVKDGKMKAEDGSKLFYMLNIMAKVVHLAWEQSKEHEIIQRLAALEDDQLNMEE